jgi:hypothetical protein
MASATIPIKSITKDMVMTVEVTGMERWRIRVKIAIQLIRVASWIMGVGVRIETPEVE